MTVNTPDSAPAPTLSPFTRRTALAVGGLTVATVAAACGSDTTPTSTTPATGGSSAASGGTELAKVADIPDGGSLVVGQVLLARTGEAVVGHSVVCTHAGCPVQAAGANADCNCHGSQYNATTGAVLKGPATQPLAEVAVTVKDGAVLQA
ncbi:Rieske (2Fe-2S) protein [Nakamurella sp. A5-74]|uniref:Cytochrome bc1 complex Rieske iron-sulfur subunit n=1 Tax=Nakamurella sp. A5-74 TaxID=3158264 RepID=A0AAU8DLM1_9ACTN